jgi:hypothetical protein
LELEKRLSFPKKPPTRPALVRWMKKDSVIYHNFPKTQKNPNIFLKKPKRPQGLFEKGESYGSIFP